VSSPALLYIDQTQFIDDVRTLARLLRSSDWQPDFIVGIGRGGLVPAVFLSHATGIALLSVDHSSKVPTFGDELLTKLADKTNMGEQLLIVDDINDSGKTLQYLKAAFLDAGGVAANLRVAVLIDNIRSIETVDYRACTIDRKKEPRWFVFPWEAMAEQEETLVDAAIKHHTPN
jgi:hypoxanthine phosphoribosyltransferase